LIDSAGIRESTDVVESIGIDKSKNELKSADIVLYILDGSVELDKEDKDIINSLKDKNTILIVNKSDLKQVADVNGLPFEKQINISTLTGDNIEELKEIMLQYVTSKNVNNNSIVLTNTRHINSIKKALNRTDDSIKSVQDEMVNLDLVSIDIKNIWLELGDITGNSDNEKIIDDIFSKFCVGK
jgi:tRNA modification GTPase